MLISEARDVAEISSYPKLDEALGLPDGNSQRYALFPLERANTRAPQIGGIQSLENRVARLLRRPAHKVVIENTAPLHGIGNLHRALDLIAGEPRADANFRAIDPTHLELAYEYDWPTYGRLGKIDLSRIRDQDTLVSRYAWQWGILWDRDILPAQWSREALGIPASMKVEEFLPIYVKHYAIERHRTYLAQLASKLGELPEFCRNEADGESNFQQSPDAKCVD
jgi:hypothetical protein